MNRSNLFKAAAPAAATCAAAALLSVGGTSGNLAASPYPPSPVITGVTYDWTTALRRASGSDNWPITWADDDNQYSAWGDGNGWAPGSSRVSLGVARIEGPWNAYSGFDVWGGDEAENPAQFEGKSYGILCVGGVLYMWVSPGSGSMSYEEARVARSTNHAATWELSSWAFEQSEGLVIPTFLNFGRDYAGARDGYVYAYFIELQDPDGLQIQTPGHISLGRVPADDILDRSAWEYCSGVHAGTPQWSSDIEARAPIFSDAGGVGWSVSVSYNAGLGRYLLCTEHHESGQGYLGIFDAPEPWGPWSTVSYVSNWENAGHTFYWSFPNKWLSADGEDFTLVYSGWQTEDAWHTVRGSFETSVVSLEDGVGVASPGGLFVAPNPATAGPIVHVDLATAGRVRVVVYDVRGRVVRHLFDGGMPAGSRLVPWDRRNDFGELVPAGVYVVKLEESRGARTESITLMP